MARVGPNQDINDPTILEDLRLIVEQVAVKINDHNNAFLGLTEVKATIPLYDNNNTRIIPITTLLKKQDGSSISVSGFTTSGTFTQNNIQLYTESTINTYINQAERFKDYYNIFSGYIDSWSNRDNGPPLTSQFIGYRNAISGLSSGLHEGIAQSNITIQQKDGYVSADSTKLPIVILWSGIGPTNYNANTYPQLMSVFNDLSIITTEQTMPFLDVNSVLSLGTYDGSDKNDGFLKAVGLLERTDWRSLWQKFIQMSNFLPSKSDLDIPLGIINSNFFKIPVMISNFSNVSQTIPYSATITMTPRNSLNRIFQTFHPGFVNKRITILGPGSSDQPVSLIFNDGSNTSLVNDILTTKLEAQINGSVFVINNSLSIIEIQVAFINQLNINNGTFTDWDTEDLLSDINIQISIDGHFINQNFDIGLKRDIWV